MDCPKCIGKLQKTVITERRTSELEALKGATASFDLELDKCFACGGVWFDKGELDKYLSDHINIAEMPALGQSLSDKLEHKTGLCPRCSVSMEKVPAPKLPKLTIDRCSKCQGVWVDLAPLKKLGSATTQKLGFLATLLQGFRKD